MPGTILSLGVFLLFGAVLVICGDDRDVKAQEYFEQGLLLRDDYEHYVDSLPFFRAAVRLSPHNGRYWFELAQTELSANVTTYLYRRISKARQAGYHDEEKLAALEGLVPVYHQNLLESGPKDGFCKGPVPEYDQEAGDKLWDFPFIFKAMIPSEKLDSLLVSNLPYLKEMFGSAPVEFYPQNMLTKPTKMYNVPLRDAVDFLAFPEGAYVNCDASEAGTYIQWNMPQELFNEVLPKWDTDSLEGTLFAHLLHMGRIDQNFLAPYIHASDHIVPTSPSTELNWAQLVLDMHWNMMLIGEAGAGMFNHTDSLPVGSWQLQLAGHKHWTICSPQPTSSDHDNEATNACFEVELSPGDLLYYPPRFWHQTFCRSTPTISLSSSILHPADHTAMALAISQGCRGESSFRFSSSLCAFFP